MLSASQIVLLGVIASALTFGIKMISNRLGSYPNRAVLTTILYVISLGLGWLWSGVALPSFPPFSDALTFAAALFAYISAWLTAAAPVMGLATLIYNWLYDKVIVPISEKIQSKFPAQAQPVG